MLPLATTAGLLLEYETISGGVAGGAPLRVTVADEAIPLPPGIVLGFRVSDVTTVGSGVTMITADVVKYWSFGSLTSAVIVTGVSMVTPVVVIVKSIPKVPNVEPYGGTSA